MVFATRSSRGKKQMSTAAFLLRRFRFWSCIVL
jgi:hypothetical protein